MSKPLSPELEAKAQELAARITCRSADSILEMARRLVATTDDTLFGNTEFLLRDQAVHLVAHAYNEFLPKKKMDTPPPPSIVHTAENGHTSTATAVERSEHSADRSPAAAPTTTAGAADTAAAPGTTASD